MKKLTGLMWSLLLLTALTVQAQTRQISGKIVNQKDGLPVSGATVTVKGTNISTASGTDGAFTLNVPADAKTFVITSVGYSEKEYPIANNLTITLNQGSGDLSEVVVVGYGTKIKKDVTGSIARVGARDFQDQPIPSFEQALQGRASGVYINSGSGKLGQGITVRVRGIASISAGQQPLIVVDGVPVNNTPMGTLTEADNPLAAINPDDIESIDVLKDASSAAIYGARGSNGVILVTTKSGKPGKTKVNVSFSHGFSDPTRKREFMNAAEYKDIISHSFLNAGYISDLSEAGDFWNNAVANSGLDEWNGGYDENWTDRSFQNGHITNYNVSVNGGDSRTKFLVSVGYSDQKGILLGNSLNRVNGRLNMEHSISNAVKIGANIGLFKTVTNRAPNDNAFSNPMQLNALTPIQPAYLENGELNPYTIYYNNLFELDNAKNLGKGLKTISSAFAEVRISRDLLFRSQLGVDYNSYQEDLYQGELTQDGAGGGYGYASQSNNYVLTSTTTLNYSKSFNDLHDLDVIGGVEYLNSRYDQIFAEGRQFPNDQFQKLANAANITDGSTSLTGYSFLSYFARANYKFNDKYLLGASLRRDGSSRFGQDTRYGWFPAASLGWIISEESFLQNNRLISFLKLRGSIGRTGNAEIGNFSSRTLVSSNAYGSDVGLEISQLGDKNLSWEKTDQYDLGIEFGFFNNRISGEIDYFYKDTKDLLLTVNLPSANGFLSITRNVGNMENKGFEFTLNTKNTVGEFKWNTSFNISTYKNKITKLVAPVSPSGRNLGRLEVGQPFGQFYGLKYMGVDPENGNALFLAKDGKNTVPYTEIANAGQFILGDPNPEFYGGINNHFSYKRFDLDVQCQFVSGNDIYNVAGIYQSANANFLDNQSKDQNSFWREVGQKTNIPKPIFDEPNGNQVSSRWIEDGSYFRVKSINLGYNLPREIISRVKITSARFYVAANNLFTFTNYEGYDPELNSGENSSLNFGHDFYTPPQARTISFGVNLGF